MQQTPIIVVTFMNGPEDGRNVFAQGPSISIGRGSGNDIVIDFDPGMAQRHLEIILHDGEWHLVVQSDRHELYVDGVRLYERGLLVPGKLVSIAGTLFKVSISDDE